MRRRQHEQREMEIQRKLGAAIKRRAAAKGLEPSALAVAADVDLSQTLKVLAGKPGVSVYSLDRIATALGYTVAELWAEAFPPQGRRPMPRSVRSVAARVVRHEESIPHPKR